MVLWDSKTKALKNAKICKSEDEGFGGYKLLVAVPQNFLHQFKPFNTPGAQMFVLLFFSVKKAH